jgi:2-methylcitrate dehydratase PrpD
MCWDEANDGLARAHGRPGLPVAPLALVALHQGRPLAEALGAYALGYEVAARAGELWRIRPGMHVDGSWHTLGAAAAAARLAGLDAAGVARAVRLVACQMPFSLYAPIAAGMDGRNLYPAQSVFLGSSAAAAAAAGLDAPEDGFAIARQLALLAETPERSEPPGTWLIAEGYAKPFAGVRHAHYAAAATLALRPRVPHPERVTRILVETYAEALTYAGNRAPARMIAAQFSLSWAVAAALVQGDLGPAAFTEAALADPLLRRLEALVELRADPAMTRRAARVTVEADGAVLTEAVDGVAGDPDRPMAEAAIAAKFRRFATPALGAARAEALARDVLNGAPDATLDPFAQGS